MDIGLGQVMMEEAEIQRNTVEVQLELSARNPGCSAVITQYVTIKVNRGESLATLQDELVQKAAEDFRANLEVAASIQNVEFRE